MEKTLKEIKTNGMKLGALEVAILISKALKEPSDSIKAIDITEEYLKSLN